MSPQHPHEGTEYEAVDLASAPPNDLDYYTYELAFAGDVRHEFEGPHADFPAVWMWADRYIPFERLTPAQLAARDELRRRRGALLPAAAEILHASYSGLKPANADIENLLPYNGGCHANDAIRDVFNVANPTRHAGAAAT